MKPDIIEIQDRIIECALASVPFEGWSWSGIENAATQAGHDPQMAAAVFPQGLSDAIDHFSDRADRRMLNALSLIPPDDLRVRDRIKTAVLKRYEVLSPYREATRSILGYHGIPGRQLRAGSALWRTADRIWDWAGDTATDYNHYTKRLLLCGVIASTTLIWLGDNEFAQNSEHSKTARFLDSRIENVLSLGKITGKIIGKMTRQMKTRF